MQDLLVIRFLQGSRQAVLARAGILIAVIAILDWHFEEDISFGFLYLFPMLMVGSCLSLASHGGGSGTLYRID